MSKRFLNYDSSISPEDHRQCFEEYFAYLKEMKTRFPINAFDFASADWHWDASDPRCPHDAWLERLEIREVEIEKGSSKRDLVIEARFLGAYHDGYFTLKYHDVKKYNLDKASLEFPPNMGSGQGDWLIDEVYLDDDGLVIHDIEFANNGRWTIHCGDVEYTWQLAE